MTAVLHRLFKRLMGAAVALCLSLTLLLVSSTDSAEAALRSPMSGDYVNDTLEVVNSLKETIALPQDSEGHASAESEAVTLITDYISVYRNRTNVSNLPSFTTMQTALNSLAGHYKNSANRPIPEKLKNRLNKEFEEAGRMVEKGS